MIERIWAVVDDGIIANTIVGDDAFADLIRSEHDGVFEITDLLPRPGMGWIMHGDSWRPPMPEGAWEWDEESQAWIETSAPEPDPVPGE